MNHRARHHILEAAIVALAAATIIWYVLAGTDGQTTETSTASAHPPTPAHAIATTTTTIDPTTIPTSSGVPAPAARRTPTAKRTRPNLPATARPARRAHRPRSSSQGALPIKRHNPPYLPRTGAGQ